MSDCCVKINDYLKLLDAAGAQDDSIVSLLLIEALKYRKSLKSWSPSINCATVCLYDSTTKKCKMITRLSKNGFAHSERIALAEVINDECSAKKTLLPKLTGNATDEEFKKFKTFLIGYTVFVFTERKPCYKSKKSNPTEEDKLYGCMELINTILPRNSKIYYAVEYDKRNDPEKPQEALLGNYLLHGHLKLIKIEKDKIESAITLLKEPNESTEEQLLAIKNHKEILETQKTELSNEQAKLESYLKPEVIYVVKKAKIEELKEKTDETSPRTELKTKTAQSSVSSSSSASSEFSDSQENSDDFFSHIDTDIPSFTTSDSRPQPPQPSASGFSSSNASGLMPFKTGVKPPGLSKSKLTFLAVNAAKSSGSIDVVPTAAPTDAASTTPQAKGQHNTAAQLVQDFKPAISFSGSTLNINNSGQPLTNIAPNTNAENENSSTPPTEQQNSNNNQHKNPSKK